MLSQSRRRNTRAFPEGLVRGLPGAFPAGRIGGLLPLVWIRQSICSVKACSVSKTQLDKLNLDLSGIRPIFSYFKRSPSSLICLGDRKGVGFSRLNRDISGDRQSVEVNKISSSIS